MRSIFWIGCILAILLAVFSFGVSAETMEPAEGQVEMPVVEEMVNETAAVTEPVAETGEILTETVETLVDESAKDVSTIVNETETVADVPAEETDLIYDTLVTYVKDAKNFALTAGKTNALTAFNDREGVWASPDMAIFAYDKDGNVLAMPLDLNKVGLNQLSTADPQGLRYIELMRNAAKSGGDFVMYTEADPADAMILKEKTAYILPVDGSWWIGASVFTPVIEETVVDVAIPESTPSQAPEMIEPVAEETSVAVA